MSAQPTKLMHSGSPSHIDMIANLNMPAQSGMTTHDQAISHDAIMGNMTVGKKYILRTNDGVVL
jgi:hypothetical protein